MSLADEWDAIPAGSAPKAAKASLADDWESITPAEAKAAAKAAQPSTAAKGFTERAIDAASTPYQVAANQVSGIGHAIMGGWRGLAAIASGAGLEEAARQVASPELAGGARAATYRPEEGTPAGAVVAAMESPWNPLNWPGLVAHKAGEVTADVTGSPAAGALVEAGGNLAPMLLVKKGATPRAEPKLVGSSSIADAVPSGQTPIAAIAQGENLDIPTVMRRGGGKVAVEAKGRTPLTLVPKEGEPAPVAETPPKPVLSLVPAEPTPGRTGPAFEQPGAKGATAAPEAPKFTETAPLAEAGGKLPPAEQARRAAVLRRVGIEDARRSAIEGDPTAASTDYQTSLVDSPAGRFAKAKIDEEKAALAQHGEQIVRDTGGTLGTDGQTLEVRGHTILSPLEGFRQWFTDKTTGLYNEARARAAGTPLQLGKFNEVLGTDSKFANTDTIELRKGITARMRELGMIDKDGKAMPATVEQAENLRQYINEEWSPKSNGRIRELKNALDEDVTSAAGEDLYKQARALHSMKQTIFADPKGLSSILDSEGINRKVPVEKIADTISGLPNAQFEHIVKTLKTVPPELAPQAQAALAEIKAHMANRILDAGAGRVGQWGARDVSAYLNKNAAKLKIVFSPDELAKIGDLNEAGHILTKPQGYPGASVQEHNLMRRGAMVALPKGGAMLGGALGALVGAPGTGALIGDAAGSGVASRMGEAAALKATQKRWTKLSEFPK
jgi:hypothetical protein